MERVNRRLFMAAAGSAGAWLVLPVVGTKALAAPLEDPVLAHIVAEFQRVEKAFNDGAFRADDYRAAALNFSLWAAHAKATRFDFTLRTALRRESRASIVGKALERHHAEMTRGKQMAMPSADRLGRGVDHLLARGIIGDMERAADNLLLMHQSVVKRMADTGGGGIRRVQGDDPARCALLRQQCDDWQNYALIICAATWWVPGINWACIGATTAAAAYCYSVYYYGC